MSLCRFYPSPSDRMAIIWSLMPIDDTIVLEYGPAGTTHFGGGMYSSLGISLENSLFTTHISEDDVIMGDVTRLEKAIVELDQAYHPKVIFVVASAVIAVIGTDIKGVCRYMQNQVEARLVTFEDGGFRGDYTYGLRAVYSLMAKELISDMEGPQKRTYNILGASAGSYRIRSDVWELKQLMKEAFGFDCCLTMGLECSMEQMQSAGGAVVNLVIRNEALEAADILQKKYGTPYVYEVPYGYQGTSCWLKQIASVIGEKINSSLLDRLENKLADMLPVGGPMARIHRKQPTASILGDYDTVTGLAKALLEMNVIVDKKFCSHSLKGIEPDKARTQTEAEDNRQSDIIHYNKERECLEQYKKLHEQWILGDCMMPKLCPEDNYFTCVSFPFTGKRQIANHLPFMGEKGMDYLMECKEEYFSKIGI